jgi:hypothetical protein
MMPPLTAFTPDQESSDGWPPFTSEYQQRLLCEKARRESDALGRVTLERRQRMQAERERCEPGISLIDLAAAVDRELAEGIKSAQCRLGVSPRDQLLAREMAHREWALKELQYRAWRDAAPTQVTTEQEVDQTLSADDGPT